MTYAFNRYLKRFLIGFICLTISATAALAQDTYVWEEYGIGFSVASDMVVDDSDPESFTATTSEDEISINITPWSDDSVDEDNLGEAALEMATELYLFDDSEVDGDYIEIDTFNGFYLIVAPSELDAPDFMIIALMLDTESDTNFVVAIGFEDGNDDEAIDVLNSFFSY